MKNTWNCTLTSVRGGVDGGDNKCIDAFTLIIFKCFNLNFTKTKLIHDYYIVEKNNLF